MNLEKHWVCVGIKDILEDASSTSWDNSMSVVVQVELLESCTPLEPGADAKYRQEDDQVQERWQDCWVWMPSVYCIGQGLSRAVFSSVGNSYLTENPDQNADVLQMQVLAHLSIINV